MEVWIGVSVQYQKRTIWTRIYKFLLVQNQYIFAIQLSSNIQGHDSSTIFVRCSNVCTLQQNGDPARRTGLWSDAERMEFWFHIGNEKSNIFLTRLIFIGCSQMDLQARINPRWIRIEK